MPAEPLDRSGAVSDLLVNWDLLNAEREEAVHVALWSYRTLAATATWRWFRRRYLREVFEQHTHYADQLRRSLLGAERRGAWKSNGTLG